MSWERRLLAVDDGAPLTGTVEELLSGQVGSWELLRDGVDSLRQARSRELSIGRFQVVARHIPHRIRSTTARTDPGGLRARPCFLCEANLPVEQLAVGLGSDYRILCNPFPILEDHLTIVRSDHVPQRLAAEIPTMLHTAKELRGYMVLYNGAECGASAPDHMHFQACRPAVPLAADLLHARNGAIPDYGRGVFVLRGAEPQGLRTRLERLLGLLHELDRDRPEPMVNLVTLYGPDGWAVAVFPRARHRPEVFHTGELIWSPGAIDLCGVIVLPVAGDLERATPETILTGFREVSLAPDLVGRIAAELDRLEVR